MRINTKRKGKCIEKGTEYGRRAKLDSTETETKKKGT